ncbi:MAG: plasmid mobilization relaxosome protein MobC [Alphaproteobacteria bacterium]|nr:plasmid mobilization relaxosome protein MobC [Alphaproteobacteria bacterium]
MSSNSKDLQRQFQHTARALCRPLGRYDSLKQFDTVSDKKTKSYAQVAPLVRPPAVRQRACELKLGRERPYRLMARFSHDEKAAVQHKAKAVRLSLSEYIRASVLGSGYVSSVDPARQKLLHDLSRELGRQGNNLNQIAKQLNMAGESQQSESMLAEIFDSLLEAHNAVRRAMAERKLYE